MVFLRVKILLSVDEPTLFFGFDVVGTHTETLSQITMVWSAKDGAQGRSVAFVEILQMQLVFYKPR